MRVSEDQADQLFQIVAEAIKNDQKLNATPWFRADELGKRQMIWTHEYSDGGKKYLRPLVEEAVKAWDKNRIP